MFQESNYGNYNSDISKVALFLCIISIIFIGIVVGSSFSYKSTPIYEEDGVKIYYEAYNDCIKVVNDNQYSIEINIGDDYHVINNTNNRKVTLGLNSNYGQVYIGVNGDTIKINYEEQEDGGD